MNFFTELASFKLRPKKNFLCKSQSLSFIVFILFHFIQFSTQLENLIWNSMILIFFPGQLHDLMFQMNS